MRLVTQVSLEFRKGKSDKVYEVDLCELGHGQFVVNFRYGRRGTTLREGTKTSAPVSGADAEEIFTKLVASKVEKGYKSVSPPGAVPAETPVENASHTGLDARRRGVLDRLTAGDSQPDSKWPLSRAVWRAGELRLREAEPLLVKLIGSGDAMLDYSIAWALGQCGSEACVPALRVLEADRGRSNSVRRIAGVALMNLLSGAEREAALEECFRQLPAPLADLARHGPEEQFSAALGAHLSGDGVQPKAFGVLEILYLIDNEFVRPALLESLSSLPLEPNYFQRLRSIFKAAELRRDAEVFGLIAHRFETNRARSAKPFNSSTRDYLRRRVWWTLRRLAALEDPDYVRLAVGVLLPFTDSDGRPPGRSYTYDHATRGYGTIHYDRFGNFWSFNNIIYGKSERYAPNLRRTRFRCLASFEPGGKEPTAREESYPELWEAQPASLLELLRRSRCEAVHRFAARALRACTSFCRELDVSTLLDLLDLHYEVSVELGFDLCRERYDPRRPNSRLLAGIANARLGRAREQAREWLRKQKQLLTKDTDLIVALVASAFDDTRGFAREILGELTLSVDTQRVLVGKLIAQVQASGEEDGERVAAVTRTLVEVFEAALRTIGVDVVRDLLAHRLEEVQRFAGEILLVHEILSRAPPADIVQALLDAESSDVRSIAVRIIAQLPDNALKKNLDLLVALSRHRLEDIRVEIRPTVLRLAQSDEAFGRRIAQTLLDALLVPGAPEGVPSHMARVLREDLRGHLKDVPSVTVWKLLQSRSMPAQEVGGVLLETNVRAGDLSVKEIVKLADHQVLSVREAAWSMCRQGVDRLRETPEVPAGLVDSRWEDTRRFAFEFLREHFVEDGLFDANVLVGICDSVRPDVQRFGRDLIVRVFADEQGEEYVLKLSEHPAESMQLFASNFLERHAADNSERLRQLAPYFVSILARVNKGGVSRARAFRFLEREALKSAEAAAIVAEILVRHSATIAIGDKACALEILLKIHTEFPTISLPVEVQPVEVRGGV